MQAVVTVTEGGASASISGVDPMSRGRHLSSRNLRILRICVAAVTHLYGTSLGLLFGSSTHVPRDYFLLSRIARISGFSVWYLFGPDVGALPVFHAQLSGQLLTPTFQPQLQPSPNPTQPNTNTNPTPTSQHVPTTSPPHFSLFSTSCAEGYIYIYSPVGVSVFSWYLTC